LQNTVLYYVKQMTTKWLKQQLLWHDILQLCRLRWYFFEDSVINFQQTAQVSDVADEPRDAVRHAYGVVNKGGRSATVIGQIKLTTLATVNVPWWK